MFSVRHEGVLVPHVVRCCAEEVERRGMDEVGIYRISGAASDIAVLRTAFDSSKAANIPLLKDFKDYFQQSLPEQNFRKSFIRFILRAA